MAKKKTKKAKKAKALPAIRLQTFPKERKVIAQKTKEYRSIYPKKLLVSQEDKIKKVEIDKLKRDLTTKRIASVRKFGGETASRAAALARQWAAKKAKSRRVLRKPGTTVTIKEHEPAPYIPIYIKESIQEDRRQFYFKWNFWNIQEGRKKYE